MNAQSLLETFLTPARTRELTREDKFLNQAVTSRFRLNGDGFARGGGNEILVYSWGEGPKVLFVHGWASRASHFEAIICEVVDKGFQAIAFDAPGHGRSGGVLSSAPAFASTIISVASKVGTFDCIVAHSLGVLASIQSFNQGLRPKKAVFLGSCRSVEPLAISFAESQGASESVIRDMLQIAHREFTQDEITAIPMIKELNAIDALFLHDPDDMEMPYEHSIELVKGWPGSKLVAVSGVGHRRILRSGGVVKQMIGFLMA